jgi:exosortase
VVFAAASFETLMVIGDVGFAAGLGIPLLLGAVTWATGGWRLLRPVALPLVFLGLMIPPPRFFLYELLFRLKLFVTDVAMAILHAAGATVAAEGNTILVPGHTLFVADACSGLTSIVTLLPLACVVAYFLSRGIWRRAVVVASVVPLAIAANVVRVVVTVALVSRLGTEAAQGVLHESFGLVTYVLGTLAVIGVARVLR